VAVNNNIDLSSTQGSLRVKTMGAQHFYSDQSGILLHANGEAVTPSIQTFSKDYPSVIGVSGIVMYAPNSAIVGGADQIYFNANDSLLLTSELLTLQSDDWIRIFSDNALSFNAGEIEATATGDIAIYSQGDVIAFGDSATLVGTVQQQICQPFSGKGVMDYTKPTGGKPFRDSLRQAQTNADKFKPSDAITVFTDKAGFTDIQFQFLPSSAYGITPIDAVIPQTLSQQQRAIIGVSSAPPWTETPVNSSYPYPGKEFAASSYASLPAHNLQNINNQLVNKTINLLNKADTIGTSNVFTNYPL